MFFKKSATFFDYDLLACQITNFLVRHNLFPEVVEGVKNVRIGPKIPFSYLRNIISRKIVFDFER